MYTLIVAHKIRCIILFHFEYIMTGFMNSNAKLHGYLRKLFHPVSLKSENATMSFSQLLVIYQQL